MRNYLFQILIFWVTLSAPATAATASTTEDSSHKTFYWPSGSGAPYSKITFSELYCRCKNDLNMTNIGCYNTTNGVLTEKECLDKPYWGLVFLWWAVAAFLIGGATTTSFGIMSDIWKTIWFYGINKHPNLNQVVDINWKNEQYNQTK